MGVLEGMDKGKCSIAFEKALQLVDHHLEKYGTEYFPLDAGENGIYKWRKKNGGWVAGFWPGILWLSWEMTGNDKYLNAVKEYVLSFEERAAERRELSHHDMGFLYSLSCVPAYIHLKDESAKNAAIEAANVLIERFREKGNYIVAWGDLNDEWAHKEGSFLIVDCFLNIPLLYWATEVTGDTKYADVAEKHLKTTVKYIIRDDGSSFHKYKFDYETGESIGGQTWQGAADYSCWSRGQSWGIYGLALNYSVTKNPDLIPYFKKMTSYFLDRLPDDFVPYWDFIFPVGSDEPRDSSAAAVVICGIMQMAEVLPDDEDIQKYKRVAEKMLNSLIDNYSGELSESNEGILLHGTDAKPQNYGIDEPTIYGDYFYLEALLRCVKEHKSYWLGK